MSAPIPPEDWADYATGQRDLGEPLSNMFESKEAGGCPHPGVGCDDWECSCTCGNCSVFGEW